ncbi:hypothetical protein [Streptomyces sp. NPDC002763]
MASQFVLGAQRDQDVVVTQVGVLGEGVLTTEAIVRSPSPP